MRILPVVLFSLWLLHGASEVAAQTLTIVAPQKALVPAALANTSEGQTPIFFTSRDGRYAVAYTRQEAKAWKLPEGELVYRYQAGMDDPRPGKGYYDKFVNRVTITADNKYIYVSGKAWVDEVLDAADLETGELVPNGLIMDSLKSGAYQMQRTVSSFDELEWNFRLSLSSAQYSPLLVRRDYTLASGLYDEGIALLAIAPAKAHPGEVIVCFKQEYCRSGKWLKEVAEKTNTTARDIEKIRVKNNHCQFTDIHAVRLNLATRKATYLGPVVRGVNKVDHPTVEEMYPSPYEDVVGIGFAGALDSIRFFNYEGQELWRAPKEAKCRFLKFDEEGNVVLHERMTNGITYLATRKPLTGVLVNRYQLPDNKPFFLEAWGMTANIMKAADGNFSLTLNDAFTGRMMLALTDQEAAARFANLYKAEVARAEKEKQQRIKENLESYARWEERSRNARLQASAKETEHYQRNQAAAEQHSKQYKPCPACGGSGGQYVQETYTESTTTTLWGGPRVGAAGYQTTTKTYNTPYKKFVQCHKCWGKGEVRR